MLLGETIAPFRVLTPALGVVPVQGRAVLNAVTAAAAGARHLAAWLRGTETAWTENCAKGAGGQPRLTLLRQLDYMRKLSAQLSVQGSRLVYAKAGTLFSAAVLEDAAVVVDHMAYWAVLRGVDEGRYLSAILNSDAARERIAPMQPKGQGGARHFDNLVWELPIPEYDRAILLHRELADAAATAERVAALVPLAEGAHFVQHRRAIRAALAADGIAARIDGLVARLLAA